MPHCGDGLQLLQVSAPRGLCAYNTLHRSLTFFAPINVRFAGESYQTAVRSLAGRSRPLTTGRDPTSSRRLAPPCVEAEMQVSKRAYSHFGGGIERSPQLRRNRGNATAEPATRRGRRSSEGGSQVITEGMADSERGGPDTPARTAPLTRTSRGHQCANTSNGAAWLAGPVFIRCPKGKRPGWGKTDRAASGH